MRISYGVRRQSEATTALWLDRSTFERVLWIRRDAGPGQSKAVSRYACHRTPKRSPRQRLWHARQRVCERRDHRAVLLQLVRVYFVERIGRRVMIIEIRPRVLNRRKGGHACRTQRPDVGTRFLSAARHARSLTLKDYSEWLQQGQNLRLARRIESHWMPGAEIGFDRREMIGDLCFVIVQVGTPTHQAVLFVHPGNDSNGALRAQV